MNYCKFQREVHRAGVVVGWVGNQTHDSMLDTFALLFPPHKAKNQNLRLVKPQAESVPLARNPEPNPQAAVR